MSEQAPELEPRPQPGVCVRIAMDVNTTLGELESFCAASFNAGCDEETPVGQVRDNALRQIVALFTDCPTMNEKGTCTPLSELMPVTPAPHVDVFGLNLAFIVEAARQVMVKSLSQRHCPTCDVDLLKQQHTDECSLRVLDRALASAGGP